MDLFEEAKRAMVEISQEADFFTKARKKSRQGLEKKEIASIHEIGVENDICIIPDYERGDALLEALGSRIFGARTDEAS